ncbi:hypothetical protein RvY_01899-2 [Ramazzottius varieornatus]|uniref:GB1/RHD3-type G domain-containing protein n=1 Tax=Ramazzottius varieornatus TaxID=947166 RepID=A0A1D1UIS2_RAMVA|nr:hypothetical protein RvY_01899-2 [Ramazzottius varieornatus]
MRRHSFQAIPLLLTLLYEWIFLRHSAKAASPAELQWSPAQIRVNATCVTSLSPEDCCWCSAVSRPERLIQIAQAEEETGSLKLTNVVELKLILQSSDIDDAKVVILSVVGETRAGKSTLLNIIYRYLACHHNKSRIKAPAVHEWLYEREDPEWKSAPEVFGTSSRFTAHTKDVWMTRYPFVIRSKHRQSVAVFLVDTQGLFDINSSSSVDSQLFYLSSLLSSTLVVNKMRRLDGQLTKQVAAYTLQMTSSMKSSFPSKKSIFYPNNHTFLMASVFQLHRQGISCCKILFS